MAVDQDHELILYGYWRSSASYRVRLALAFKGLNHQSKPIHLIDRGGEHTHPDYRALNPQALVPTLIHRGQVLTQSLAIIEYLDEAFPEKPLLPSDPILRANTRALALAIVADTAPIQNLRVLDQIRDQFQATTEQTSNWARHWITVGLDGVEKMLQRHHLEPAKARFCIGTEPSLADCCLLPQVYNAQRFGCDMATWPTIRAICANLGHNEAIDCAKPENQTDAPNNTNP